MQERAGASEEDGDGLVHYPMTACDIEAAIFMKELSPGVYRTSLRSKGEVNVARIAERFGGGGHRNAAGCTMYGDWDAAERQLVEHILDALDEQSISSALSYVYRNGNSNGRYRGALETMDLADEELLSQV